MARGAPGWTPPARLTDFLQAGPPPVFVGFGSMAATDPEHLGDLVARALRLARVRGWSRRGGPGCRWPATTC